MKVLVSLAVLALLAVSHSAYINTQDEKISQRSFVDLIIRGILEGMRPKLANLTMPDINETIKDPNLNATIIAKNISIQGADKYIIRTLKSDIIPLRLANLTMFWKDIVARSKYDVKACIRVPQVKDVVNITANGEARASFYGVFFTIGANMEMKNNALQIKPKGLFGFDFSISKANITVGTLMGSPQLGQIVDAFLSNAIPGLVNDIKKPLFDAMQDDIIKAINQVLKKNGTTLMDEVNMSPEDLKGLSLDLLDLQEELGVFDDSFESEESSFEL